MLRYLFKDHFSLSCVWLAIYHLTICLVHCICLRYELLFFPRYHLDHSSLLYRKPLLGRPIVMDVFQDYILVTYSPFDVHIFHVMISGELSPTSSPVLQVTWEFCILNVDSFVSFCLTTYISPWLNSFQQFENFQLWVQRAHLFQCAWFLNQLMKVCWSGIQMNLLTCRPNNLQGIF